jgi:hypothetical protein
MQTPITREIAQLSEGSLWRKFPSLLRFIFRIVAEGRGNELFFNALREIRYATSPPCEDREAIRFDRNNLIDMNSHLAPQLTALGYRRVIEFASSEEVKCLVVGDRLICMTRECLRFYDMQRTLRRTIEVEGSLSNFVYVAGRIYFVVDGSLYSLTGDGDVRNENLSLSCTHSTVLDQGIAVDLHGNLVVAEYKHDALGESGAYLYVRRPGEDRWTTVSTLARRVDKHCHIVVFDSASQVFYVTSGDTRKMLARLDLRGPQVKLDILSAGAWKTGGYMCAAAWEGGLMCGTDYTGGTNYLVFLRDSRIRSKEALRNPFRRSIVGSVEATGEHLLFAAWNMGHLPKCCNGLLLKSPTGTRPLCYSEDVWVEFELFPSADGLVVRGSTPDRRVFGVYHRS